MTTTAQAGIFGFGPQVTKGTKVLDTVGNGYFRHRGTMIDLGPVDDSRIGQPEVGGVPLPTLPYKGGVIVQGGATLNPRLESSIGWLLYGAFGYVTSAAGGGTTRDHTFGLSPTNPSYVPWMGFRKFIPNDVPAKILGEQYHDCKIVGLTLTLPNDDLISARVDVIGRTFDMSAGSACTWGTSTGSTSGWKATTGEFESYESIPIGCNTGGGITVNGTELPVLAATVSIQNIPVDLRQERVYGDPYLDNITIVGRAVALDLTVKWNDPDLYRSILTGAASGTTWSPKPFIAPVVITAVSPDNIVGEAEPYSLTISIAKAMLALNGSVQLAGNQAVIMRFTGTALEYPGNTAVTAVLTNKVTSYTWPT
jgi:hypothetical protein